MQTLFHHFTNNTWLYQNEVSNRTVEKMSAEERSEFYIDVSEINWTKAIRNLSFGLRLFHIKEDIMHPAEQK